MLIKEIVLKIYLFSDLDDIYVFKSMRKKNYGCTCITQANSKLSAY